MEEQGRVRKNTTNRRYGNQSDKIGAKSIVHGRANADCQTQGFLPPPSKSCEGESRDSESGLRVFLSKVMDRKGHLVDRVISLMVQEYLCFRFRIPTLPPPLSPPPRVTARTGVPMATGTHYNPSRCCTLKKCCKIVIFLSFLCRFFATSTV